MGRLCIFCEKTKPTKEHVLPSWLTGVLPGDGEFTFTHDHGDGSVSSWSAKAMNMTVKRVCGPCNHGWMSQLEARCKPLMIPMIHGESQTLDREEQTLLATWATKTAIVIEQARRGQPSMPHTYRRYICEHLEPPPGTWVVIGKYGGGRAAWFDRFDGNLAASDRSGAFQAVTMSLGQLVFQVYSLFIEKPHEIAIDRATPLPELWPNQGDPVAWPPPLVPLDDQKMHELAKSLLIGQEMLGRGPVTGSSST